MKIKQKVIMLACLVVTGLGVSATFSSPVMAADCGEVKTSIIGGDVCAGVNNDSGKTEDNAIWKLLILALNIMTAGVGILAVGGIVYASVLYASAGDSAEQTKSAISIITNVVIGIVAYGLMYVGLNFLIPGGVFT